MKRLNLCDINVSYKNFNSSNLSKLISWNSLYVFNDIKIIDFINNGSTSSSVNFPKLNLPEQSNSHRLIHIHKNEPGVMLEINKIISNYNINIKGQYLKTNEDIGYVITDINSQYNNEVVKSLKNISATIKIRVLY